MIIFFDEILNLADFFFFFSSGSGKLEFEEFCILAARFLIEEDEEQMRKELKEAFRFYDKEGNTLLRKINYYQYYYNKEAFRFYDKEGNIIVL